MPRTQSAEERRLYRRKRKEELVAYKGNRCERCGGEFPSECFDFHHRDPTAKEFTLDRCTMTDRAWKAIVAEADKCSLLCACCHRSVHHNQEEDYFEYFEADDDCPDSGHRDGRNHSNQMSLFSNSELPVSD